MYWLKIIKKALKAQIEKLFNIYKHDNKVFERFLDDTEHWCGLKSVIQIISTRFDKKSKKETVATRYYISSLEKNEARLAKIVRSHWAIENNLHWRLDVSFNEDKQMKRKNNSAFNFNIISKIAMTLIDK